MNRLRALLAVFVVAMAACGGGGPASCAEYATELREKAATLSPEELTVYVDDTAEDVARLISDRPADAQACADAVLEVLFQAGLDGAFSGFED